MSPRKPLIIRDVNLGNGVILAPMAGITDSPVRRLAKRYGVDMVVSEMVAAQGLSMVKRNSALQRQLAYARHHEDEKPFCVQLFGKDPAYFAKATPMVLDEGADLIDINLGCPVKKVVNSGSGSALLKDPPLIGKIVAATRACGEFPLTVKMRLGWDHDSENFIEVAKICVDAGADAVILHARTRSEMFGGHSHWDRIAQLKQAIDVPVIGNGDIVRPEDAVAMFEQTGCDGIMIGRGANGRPWFFAQIQAALEGRKIPPAPNAFEVLDVFESHLRMLCDVKGVRHALLDIRKHLLWYTKGRPGANEFRRNLYNLGDPEKVMEAARVFFRNAGEQESLDATG